MRISFKLTSFVIISALIISSCSKDESSSSNTNNSTQIPTEGIIYKGDYFIYVMNTDGTNSRQLSLSKEYYDEDYPSSSPDGKKIVFTRYSKGIVVQDNTGEKIILGDADSPEFTTWSYNSKIYYTRWNALDQGAKEYIYSINTDGTGEVQVSPVYNSIATPLDYYPSVSPDNNYLLFSTNRTGNGGAIMKLNLSDGSNSYLTYSGTTTGEEVICPAEMPTWSPDGTKIAFAAWPGYPDFTLKEQIYIMNANGTGKIQLTADAEADCNYPSWSPDGTKIVFQKSYPGFSNCYEIWIMNADGTNAKALTDRNKTGYEQHPSFIGKPR